MRTPIVAGFLLIGTAMLLAVLLGQGQAQVSSTQPDSFLDLDVVQDDVREDIKRVQPGGVVRGSERARNIVPEALESKAEGYVENFRLASVDGKKTSRAGSVGRFRPGGVATLEFDAKRDGFVSIWSRDANGKPSRLVPNKFMKTTDNALRVRAGAKYRASGRGLFEDGSELPQTEEWQLTVKEPYGMAEVFLRWAESAQEHLTEDAFVDLDAFGKALRSAHSRGSPASRRNLTIRYEVAR